MKTKSVPFTFRKDGYFYFTRRIPTDLRGHYQASRIVEALRTNSASIARVRAMVAASKLDEFWSRLRIASHDVPGRKILREQLSNGVVAPTGLVVPVAVGHEVDSTPLLSEAVANYVRVKGTGRGKTFKSAAERSCGYVIDAAGEKPIGSYTRSDALKLRDMLLDKGLTGSSITRIHPQHPHWSMPRGASLGAAFTVSGGTGVRGATWTAFGRTTITIKSELTKS